MHNANKPTADDLPSSATLLRSTLIAVGTAVLILVTIVLPAEYGVDPLGVGGILGLTEVGEIKTQLAEEAVEASVAEVVIEPQSEPDESDSTPVSDTELREDSVTIELAPGEGAEIKLVMTTGDQATFSWSANGSILNYNQHGDGGGQSITYEKGRGVASGEGLLEAAFDGYHGWFWRNRTDAIVKLTLETRGIYVELKRTA
jgi:hypothetical protein